MLLTFSNVNIRNRFFSTIVALKLEWAIMKIMLTAFPLTWFLLQSTELYKTNIYKVIQVFKIKRVLNQRIDIFFTIERCFVS